jgi:hypothetical protein
MLFFVASSLLIKINKKKSAREVHADLPQKRRCIMRSKITKIQDMRLKVQMSNSPCRHLANGRTVIPKMCIYNYECWRCAFEQWLDELEVRQGIPAVAA